MKNSKMSIVITGHVDHGKSTLIGRILLDTDSLCAGKLAEIEKISGKSDKNVEIAFLIDQLKEEREQLKTIDTSQIFFRTKKREYVIIDSPVHFEYIKNMITGATQADTAVLVVDAKEGVREQTGRHICILGILGIENIVAVVNKMDSVNYKKGMFEKIKSNINCIFDRLSIRQTGIIPISAKYGINITAGSNMKMPWYKGPALLEILDNMQVKSDCTRGIMYLPVQDIYKYERTDVIVGRVSIGKILKGQVVKVFPAGENARVLKIIGNRNVGIPIAKEDENVGIVLSPPIRVSRGDVIISDSGTKEKPSREITANIFWFSRRPLNLKNALLFRCATQEAKCRVAGIEKIISPATMEILNGRNKGVKAGEAGIVKIKLQKPVVVEKFSFIRELGRFSLEYKGMLCGVGTIIDKI